MSTSTDNPVEGIAIVGMAGRFPGARSVAEFWHNLVHGVESITHFTEGELEVNGPLTRQPNYVRARGVLDEVERFDARFFGFTPREAELTDPQHRLFLECAWEALEDAGWDPGRFPGAIGVYAGCSLNTYLLHNLCGSREFIETTLADHQMSYNPALLGNDKDFLATRVAYKLNLRGPAVTVQTACSTSLVAVCQACASLLAYQCDAALAGGVSLSFPQKRGYPYLEGAMVSSDGRCRPFDAAAQGTVFGGGVGVVVLRRLADALEAGDRILAVIKGAALNNDGAQKVSYMAPSVDGQAEVISLAQALAGATADTISYVEAHGTGTPLGDPIELAGLTQAFRATTEKKQFCALGSVKSNIGHLEAAAGVAGLIKTVLALHHRQIPPTLHFREPNPNCDFANSPFYVVAKLTEWTNVPLPRRAGVSAFGVGGTNAHVVLEEAPPQAPSGPSRPAQLLVFSARSAPALETATDHFTAWLRANAGQAADCPRPPGEDPRDAYRVLADAAFTLQTGRKVFEHRRIVVATGVKEAAELLEQKDPRRVYTQACRPAHPQVVFMFPGQGAQYVNMGRQLYATEKVFRQHVDAGAELLQPQLQLDLRSLLYPPEGQEESARAQLAQTGLTQPALFLVEYALARLWQAWGIEPAALVGHSLGEYVAAVLAGVMTLEDGLGLLVARARLMEQVGKGGMLAVRLPEAEVRALLGEALAVAVVNSPRHCVVAGPTEELADLQRALERRRVACKPLCTSHAFHSPSLEPIVGPFADCVRQVKLHPARIPIVSTLTGRWMQAEEWTDPMYWSRQLRHPVRFADAVNELVKNPDFVLLEVGPGQTLTQLAQQHPGRAKDQLVLSSMPPLGPSEETVALLTALGRLWLAGVDVHWEGFYREERRRRVPLPTYPFERQRYWIDPPSSAAVAQSSSPTAGARANDPTHSEARLASWPTASAPAGAGPAFQPNGPVETAAAGGAARVEQIISEQLRLMSLQLQALSAER